MSSKCPGCSLADRVVTPGSRIGSTIHFAERKHLRDAVIRRSPPACLDSSSRRGRPQRAGDQTDRRTAPPAFRRCRYDHLPKPESKWWHWSRSSFDELGQRIAWARALEMAYGLVGLRSDALQDRLGGAAKVRQSAVLPWRHRQLQRRQRLTRDVGLLSLHPLAAPRLDRLVQFSSPAGLSYRNLFG